MCSSRLLTPDRAFRKSINRKSSILTGRQSAPNASEQGSGSRSPRASSKRTAARFGWRASRATERDSTSRCELPPRTATPRRLRPRRNLQRVADAQLREEANQATPFVVRRLINATETLHLVRVFAARDRESVCRLLGKKDSALRPGVVVESISDELRVFAANRFVAIDRLVVNRRGAAQFQLVRDEIGEHVAKAIARFADRGEETNARLDTAARILRLLARRASDDLALHRDLVAPMRKTKLTVLLADGRGVMDARSQHSDFHQRHCRRAEGAGHWRIERQPLEFAAFCPCHGRTL